MTKKKNENRIAGVYKITNIINNKVYIGESLNIEERWREHKKELESGIHHSYKLQNDYNIYGFNKFIYEVIEEIDKNHKPSLQQLILIVYEDKYIKEYNSLNNGYNCEDTLWKILNKEKGVFDDNKINDNNLKILKGILANINKHNGKYMISQRKKNNNKKHKHKTVNDINIPCSFLDCIYYLTSTKYVLNNPINKMYEKFRELNIFYYDEHKRNLPNKEYLNTYFITETINYNNNINNRIRILVTDSGIDFITKILLDNNLILPK